MTRSGTAERGAKPYGPSGEAETAFCEDNVRLLELLMEVEACQEAWARLPLWLQGAIEGEIECAEASRQSALDQAYRRGREGWVQARLLVVGP